MVVHFDFTDYFESTNSLRFRFSDFDSLITRIVSKFNLLSWSQVLICKVPNNLKLVGFKFSNRFNIFVCINTQLHLIGVGAVES